MRHSAAMAYLKPTVAALAHRSPGRWLVRLAAALLAPRSRVGVVAVAFDPEGWVLLAHHLFRPAEPWGLPGGWLRRKESPAEGLARELREELGWEVTPGEVVGVVRQTDPWHLTIGLVLEAQRWPVRLSWELAEVSWCDPQALPPGLKPATLELIAAALGRRETG